MKKGCFITTIVLFTILVAAVVYVVKYKKDFLKEFSKHRAMDIAVNEFDKKLSEVKMSLYKDSLQNEFHRFIKKNEHIPFDSAMWRIKGAMTEVQYLLRYKKIDSLEYNNFKKYLIRYERSEKNRN